MLNFKGMRFPIDVILVKGSARAAARSGGSPRQFFGHIFLRRGAALLFARI